MPTEDQEKWDQRYAAGEYLTRTHPSELLKQWIEKLPVGRAADLACGRGRNSHFLAQQGNQVDAYDISAVGLELAAQSAPREVPCNGEIRWLQRDLLEQGLPSEVTYDVIVMFRFVALDLLARLPDHLNPGGVLVVENHLRWASTEDLQLAGPRSQRFRVAATRQRAGVADLTTLFENEGLARDPDGSTVALAQLVASKDRI